MAAKAKPQRYVVTGPALVGEPSYSDAGPAHSRALTAASRHNAPNGTWYVRDSVTGVVLGYSERDDKTIISVRHTK